MKKIFSFTLILFLAVGFQQIFGRLFHQMELISYDARAKYATDSGALVKNFKPADKNIVIVSDDDYSMNELAKNPSRDPGTWPWKRDVWGNVVNFIEEGHPKAILFDIVFSDVNNTSYSDRNFARTLRQYNNIVLAMPLGAPAANPLSHKLKDNQYLPTNFPLNVENNNKKIDKAITFYGHAPIHDLYTLYNRTAIVNDVQGEDSVIRETQPIFKLVSNGKTYYMPSLAFAGFMKSVGEDGKIEINGNTLTYKDRKIPVSNLGRTLISWHGSGHNYPFVHVSNILLNTRTKNELSPDYFKDKIVIIGRTVSGTDVHPTAVGTTYPGPEAHATAIDNFINDTAPNATLRRKFTTKLPQNTECLIVAAFCAIIAVLAFYSRNAMFAFLNSFLVVLFYVITTYVMFVRPNIRIWLPLTVPLYYMIVTAGLVYALRINHEASKKNEIIQMFGKFVSPGVLNTLLKNSGELTLKSTKKHITTMFCDVKNFTSLSEKTEPARLVNDLNELFNEIVNIIFQNNGTVDKFVGDCIMAYWGDPISSENDEYMAVKTAIEIKKRVDELKIENVKKGKTVLDVKIGVNTGDALLGLSGSDKIMSYTAMGDAVNTASRLEGACSTLKRDILISKSTYDKVKDKIVVLEAGKIGVKGKAESLEVFEPIGFIETPDDVQNSKN
jgi:adenylate cyclase